MPDQHAIAAASAPDADRLSRFVTELGIARRNINSYPDTHPLIGTSIEKTLDMLGRVLDIQSEVSLGIVKDSLMLGDDYLDRKNPVFRDFAHSLFQRGIAVLTLRRGLPSEELLRFCHLLGERPEEIRESGGIESRVAALDLPHIGIQAMDYASLSTVEEGLEGANAPLGVNSLWERFIHGLLGDRLDREGDRISNIKFLEPEMVADLLNRTFTSELLPSENVEGRIHIDVDRMKQAFENLRNDETGITGKEHYTEVLAAYMNGVEQGSSSPDTEQAAVDLLARLIARLRPDLRKQFLPGLTSSLEHGGKTAERLLSRLSPGLIAQILEDLNAEPAGTPPQVLSVLARLAGERRHGSSSTANTALDERTDGSDLLLTLFREERREEYVPGEYQHTLNRIMDIPPVGAAQPAEDATLALRTLLTSQSAEAQTALITLELIKNRDLFEDRAELQAQLHELVDYLLETGDFQHLLKIYHQLVSTDEYDQSEKKGNTNFFSRKDFVASVLEGLAYWGKEKYPEISRLIHAVGEPFVQPMLTRLAVESNMSVRRFLIDAVSEAGSLAAPSVLPLLKDSRWFFVRNLVIILRNIGGPSVLPHVKAVCRHQNPKVRAEGLKTLLHFGDKDAEGILLQDFESKDPAVRLNAIQLASFARGLEVAERLVEIVRKGPMGAQALAVKKAAVRSLQDMAQPEVLPQLRRILGSWSLFHSDKLKELKSEILRSLSRYPSDAATPVLEDFMKSANGELLRVAQATLGQLKRRTVHG